MREFSAPFAALFGLTAAVTASAADLPRADELNARTVPAARYVPDYLWEARLGATAHDPWSPERGSADINAELLLGRYGSADRNPLWPRLHVGGSLNLGGKTSYAYAGLTWTFDLTNHLFLEASFGGAVHNGQTGITAEPGRNALGCSPLFRESGALGFRLTERWSVLATIDHMSHAGLCVHNQVNRGLTNFGSKVAYRF